MKSLNELKKIHDFSVILSLLNGAKENSTEVYVWKLISDKKHLAQVRLETIRRSRKDFLIVPSDGQELIVQKIIGLNSFVDIYIPGSSLLFRSAIRSSDSSGRYYLQIPEFVAQIDRRKNFRLVLENPSEIKISFSKKIDGNRPVVQHFNKECFDVSSGGYSFYASRLESRYFLKNDPIELVLKMEKMSIKAKAQVTIVREIDPDEFNGLSYKVWRIGCRFTEIDQLGKKYLEKFIFERIKDELRVINE